VSNENDVCEHGFMAMPQSQLSPRQRTWRRSVPTVVGCLLLLFGTLFLTQRSLMYFPDREAPQPPVGVDEVTLLTDDGLELGAWLFPGSDRLVVVFPGNAGNRSHRAPLAQALQSRGWSVLLVDYRGYGGNPGNPSETGLVADARAAQAFVSEGQWEQVIYLGESLGCGPATALAVEHPPDGLVLRSPFPSMAAAAKVHYRVVPTFLLRDRYPISLQLEQVDVPVVVVAGDADRVIPFALSQEVAEQADADLIVVVGSDHNDPQLAWGPELLRAADLLAGT
jgi:uncharacterized protein